MSGQKLVDLVHEVVAGATIVVTVIMIACLAIAALRLAGVPISVGPRLTLVEMAYAAGIVWLLRGR